MHHEEGKKDQQEKWKVQPPNPKPKVVNSHTKKQTLKKIKTSYLEQSCLMVDKSSKARPLVAAIQGISRKGQCKNYMQNAIESEGLYM